MNRARVTPIVVATLASLIVASWTFRLYTVEDPWRPHATVLRDFLAAGLRGDSSTLASHSTATQPVAWVLDAARRRPELVAGWARELAGSAGERRGDTVALVLWANNVAGCSHLNSVSAVFVNHSAMPRMVAISSPCIDRLPLPGLTW